MLIKIKNSSNLSPENELSSKEQQLKLLEMNLNQQILRFQKHETESQRKISDMESSLQQKAHQLELFEVSLKTKEKNLLAKEKLIESKSTELNKTRSQLDTNMACITGLESKLANYLCQK